MSTLYSPPDLWHAHAEWGANCGPGVISALAGIPLSEVRPHLCGFRGFMNPSGVKAALASLGLKPRSVAAPEHKGAAHIQWEGGWERAGVRAAYRYTHWVAYQGSHRDGLLIYDINAGEEGGWLTLPSWAAEVVPELLPPRAIGWRFRQWIEAAGDREQVAL